MSWQLDWSHAATDIPQNGLLVERSASEEERARLAAALEIRSCTRLEVRYRIEPQPQGRYLVKGQLAADVEQSCVVTLEPVGASVEESFEIAFWPAEQLVDSFSGTSERGVLAADDPEPLERGRLAVGRVIFELIAAGLDPYPRAQGVELGAAESRPGAKQTGEDSPFAALAEWKGRRE